MTQEIERKFLLKSREYRHYVVKEKTRQIEQGYLCVEPERTVRVRLSNYINSTEFRGHLTIKGISSDDGLSRYEFEKSIDFIESTSLLKLCEPKNILAKTRYVVPWDNHYWEIDEFKTKSGELFTMAEIELYTVDDNIELPDWIGEEVTGNPDYYNVNLMKRMNNE